MEVTILIPLKRHFFSSFFWIKIENFIYVFCLDNFAYLCWPIDRLIKRVVPMEGSDSKYRNILSMIFKIHGMT